MMRARVIGLLATPFAVGCGASGGASYSLDVGSEDGGGSFVLPEGDGGPAALDAYIVSDQVAVKFITLSCAGDCATVQAVGTGGYPPYAYAWEDGSTNPVRRVCPASDASYSVKVTDAGQTGEIPRPPQTAKASVTANVLECDDGGARGTTGSCAAGTYAGTWTGTGLVDASAAQTATYGTNQAPVTSPFAMMLSEAAGDGGADLVPSASLVLTWDVAAQWTAHLSGGLDCVTGVFRADDPAATMTVAGVAAGTCDMTLVGQYDGATATIAGSWTSDCSGADWGGTWTMTWTQ
jgi:hypothetical protein